jgi:TonB family protein
MKRFLFWAVMLVARLQGADTNSPPPTAPPPAVADGAALVRKWTPPVYPAEALRSKIGGHVMARVVVDEVGNVIAARVLTAADPRLGEAAVTAVKLWKFTPALENSKPVHVCMDVPFEFDASKGQKSWKPAAAFPEHLIPQLAPRTEAAVKTSSPGEYPATLTGRRLAGQATFACIVRPDGRAQDFRILAATHPDFVVPALAALQNWEFASATQGDLSVAVELKGAVNFAFTGGNAAGVLGANGITGSGPNGPERERRPERVIDPVWPYALLMDGQGGSATVEFTVQSQGRVTAVKVLEASQTEFGNALAAALEQWMFSPMAAEDRSGDVTLVKQAEFKAPLSDEKEPSDDPLFRLVQVVRRGKVGGGAGLDDKLTPLYQVAPGYPAALLARGRPSGRAMIEFVIDRDGRCRLPRILSATEAEFGWAAATAVGQWIFKVPRRAGQPTEVRVQIPINFTPPDV